jgi:serine/threonine protein kinase
METGSSTSKDFLTSALQKNPDHRLTAKMMLEHPFIVKYMEI